LVGGISHDFNNLLGIILGYGELLELELGSDEKLSRYAHQINMAGKRGSNLTSKLLSLTRQKNIETEYCNINILLQDEEELLKKSLTAKIGLVLQLKDNLWPVLINKSDFEDVILNLCVNAMHAMHEGQRDFKITISTENFHINNNELKEYDLDSGDYVKITVSDNGIGMDNETKSRIFEPFYTTRDTGHGLGLSQVYSFAKQSNGGVFVHSTKGEGSTFEILIPRDLDINDSTKLLDSSPDINAKGHESILVVDDESALRELNVNILNQEGYRIFQAENGIEALAILEHEKIDLVLSDIIMPIMDGNILAAKIRKLYPHIKIQLVSGYIKPDNLPKDNKDLYDNLLNKPVIASELLQRIRLLLNN